MSDKKSNKKLKLMADQPPIKRPGRKITPGKRDLMPLRKKLKDAPPATLVLSPSEKRSERALSRLAKDRDALEEASLLENFPQTFLGVKSYGWQQKVLCGLNPKESRVALKAANGSGKTSIIAASAVLWHMVRFPESLVVTTAGVWRQVEGQLWPTLRKYTNGLGRGWHVTSNSIEYENGARAIGFSTNDPGKFEGWHRQGPTENLMMIVDEAKTVPNSIFTAIARCQPSRLLLMSSPGASSGAFYEAFTKQRKFWECHTVTAFDCPHLTKEWIDDQIETYGENSPLVRSMIYGEFMDDSSEGLVLNLKSLEECLQNPPEVKLGIRVAFIDFAAGGDECVFALRNGNKIMDMVCWRDRNTNNTIGKIINLVKKHDLNQDELYADEGGLGLPLCDALMDAGYDIHRVNFGARPFDDRYGNRSAEMWHTAARAIEKQEVILPDDQTLHQQMVTRRAEVSRKGKLGLEPKDRMRARGLDSPDRADAVMGCISCGGGIGGTWERFNAITRPTLDDIWKEAEQDYQRDALPAGMFVG
jgi:hypothetical protein